MSFHRSLETILRGHESQRRALDTKVAALHDTLVDETYDFEDKIDRLRSSMTGLAVGQGMTGLAAAQGHGLGQGGARDELSAQLADMQAAIAGGGGSSAALRGSGRSVSAVEDIVRRASQSMFSGASGALSLSSGPGLPPSSLAAPLSHIRAAERRLERSIQRVQAGRPLWGSGAVRLGEEAALHRQHDAIADFKRSFDAVNQAVTRQSQEARAAIVKDTRCRLLDLVQRQLEQQLDECARLEQEEIAPALARVAEECLKQLDAWVAKLQERLAEDKRRSEESLRGTFSTEAENILVELARVCEAENRDSLLQLAAQLQEQKNQALSQAADELSKGFDARLQRMRSDSVEQLQAQVKLLHKEIERQQDETVERESALIQQEHESALRQAKAALDAANVKALQGLREKKRRELEDRMTSLARAATRESEGLLAQARSSVEQEMDEAMQAAVQQLQHAIEGSRQQELDSMTEQHARERDAQMSALKQAAAAEQQAALRKVREDMEASAAADYSKLQAQLSFERESALAAARLELEGERNARIRALEAEILRAKATATDDVKREFESEMTESVAKLKAALAVDRAKAEQALRAQKKLELQEKLQRLERQLQDETELALHDQTLQWTACRRRAEDALKEMQSVAPEDALSDEDDAAAREGFQQARVLASSASRVPGLALASAAVGRWVAALASQHRDTHTSLKAAREKLTKQARASAALQATVEAMALERVACPKCGFEVTASKPTH